MKSGYINNWAKSFDTIFPVDKTFKKGYNERNILQKKINVFDDAVANSALDYLYAGANRNQTQSFLKNNGFPSAEERQLNKEFYGVQEEQKQMRDLLKNKSSNILNPQLPDDTDRAFLIGLMGDKEGERDYQKQISGANRAISDLQNAFRGTQFEDALNPTAQISSASPAIKHVSDGKLNATNQNGHVAILNSNNEDDIAQHSDNKKFPSSIKNSAYNDGKTVAYSANNLGSEVKPSGSALTEADWEVYDALQRKGEFGAATSLHFSIEEATGAYEAAGDNKGKKTAARIQAVEARQAAYRKIGKTYVDNYDYTYGAGNSVFLGVHQVAGDNYHTSTIIMIFPNSPLYNTEGFENITESSPIQYMTLGAGPSFLFGGDLESGYNRKKDRMLVNKVDMINLNVSDATVMANLIACEKTYRQNQPLNYDVFPDPQTEGYNSNSFTKGLLNACNVAVPTNLDFNVPGWEKAVPKHYFIK